MNNCHGKSRTILPEQTSQSVRLSSRQLVFLGLAILVGAVVLYFSALGKTPLRVNAEIRCHDVISNMIERGDYIVPIYKGEPRFHKPPLFYWTVVATSRLLSGFNLTTLRIPPAVAALGVFMLLVWWGWIMRSQREAVLAMALLATAYLFVVHARRGSFEMLLTFLSNLGVLILYTCVQRPTWGKGLMASVVFGLAFLTKATPALLYMPLPVFVWLAMSGRARLALRWQVGVLALFGILIAISWHLYVIMFRPESRQTIFSELMLPAGVKVGSSSSALHHEPFYFYLTSIWRAAFPLSLFIPLAGWLIWRKRGYPADSAERLLVVLIGVPFLIFSAIPMKQDHYLLPAMPAISLLSARAIFEVWDGRSGLSRKWVSIPVGLVSLLLILATIAVGSGLYLVGDWPIALAVAGAGVVGASGVLGFLALRRGSLQRGLVAALVGTALLFWCYFAVVRPVEDGFGSGRMFLDPTYLANKDAWDRKFERMPILRKLLDVDRGLKRSSQLSKPVPEEW